MLLYACPITSAGAAIADNTARSDCIACISNSTNPNIGRCVYQFELQAAINVGLVVPIGIQIQCNVTPG